MNILSCRNLPAYCAATLGIVFLATTAVAQTRAPLANPPMKDLSRKPPQDMTGATPIRNSAQPPAQRFDALDPDHTGYVSRDGAKGDAWLNAHFDACDTDQDGRIGRPEFDACREH